MQRTPMAKVAGCAKTRKLTNRSAVAVTGSKGEDRFREPLTKVGLLSAKRFEIEDAGSMEGRGTWRDTVFGEQLWKSVKGERVYLHA